MSDERPVWCPHADCAVRCYVPDRLCTGRLPESVGHEGDFNTHRLCMWDGAAEPTDYQINRTDIFWLQHVLATIKPEATAAYATERERRKALRGVEEER